MNDPKIIFFDIDETLYRKTTEYLPQSTITAIQKLKEKGIIPAIATGRSICALPPKIHNLMATTGIELFSGINGQYNEYQGQVLTSNPINNNDIERLISFFQQQTWAYAFINEQKMVVSTETQRVKESLQQIGQYTVDPDYYLTHDIYQILVFINEQEEAFFHNSGVLPSELKTIRWHPVAIDVLPTKASKAQGIISICEKLNIPLTETMAFGDGLNDIEMFQTVGFAVAMGDAHPKLLPYANYQTGMVEEDGIYRALQHLQILP